MNFDVVRKVLAAFESKEVEYVVFGAAAINLLGLARATEDLDVFISATAENVERLKAALKNVFDDPAIAMLYEMKKSTVRPKDWGDAEALRRRFRLGES